MARNDIIMHEDAYDPYATPHLENELHHEVTADAA
jgi:hypothetical protein